MALNKAPNPAFSNWLEGRYAGREEISGQDGEQLIIVKVGGYIQPYLESILIE